ncbi:MAG: DUF4190 domain-containing protein [Aureispira sp.]|nr:DUF4190 domain-containing protein [Aureispira sp.]
MYKYQQSILSIGLLILAMLLSSASYAPTLESSRDEGKAPKVTTQQEKRQAKLNKRLNRLSSKLDRATKVKQEKRLNKRLKKVKQKTKTESNESPNRTIFVLSLIGLIFPVLALVALVLGSIFLSRTIQKPDKYGGKGYAIAAIILGVFSLIMWAILISAFLIAITNSSIGFP